MSQARPLRRRLASSVIFITILLDFAGFSILIPVLPKVLAGLGASPLEIGIVLALYVIALVLFLPVWGWISDRVGRRPVLLISMLGTGASLILMALASELWHFYLARVLGGLFGASVGTAQAYMTDITSSRDRTEGLGLVGAATAAGVIFGPAIGGSLLAINPVLPFYAPVGVALIAFLGALFFLPESRPELRAHRGWGELWIALIPTPLLLFSRGEPLRTRFFLLFFMVVFAGFATIEGMFPIYTEKRFDWSPATVGNFLSAIGLLIAVVQLALVGPLSNRFGENRVAALGLLFASVGLLGVGQAGSVGAMMFAGAVAAIGNGLWFPSFTSLYTKSLQPGQETGEYLARSVAMSQTGRGIGIVLAGAAHQQLGVGREFGIAGLVLAGALALQLFLGKGLGPRDP